MDRAALKTSLKENVLEILPHKTEEEAESIADFLLQEGVKKEVDLRHLTVPILKGILDTIDASELYVQWQSKFGFSVESVPSTSRSAAAHIRQPLTPSNALQEAVQNFDINRIPFFDKDSAFMPARVRKAINDRKRPTHNDRVDMVARMVDHCREKVPNLSRLDFDVVADNLVQLYPESFKDTLPVSDLGSEGLRGQLKAKYDNDKRGNNLTPKEKEAPREAYGCILWNPSLPEGETEGSLKGRRDSLIAMAKTSIRHHDWRQVRSDMEATFYLQRKDINGPPLQMETPSKKRRKNRRQEEENIDNPTGSDSKDMKKLMADWPFLFKPLGMNFHFKLLTGVDFSERLDNYLLGEGKLLIELLSSKSTKMASLRRKMTRHEGRGNTNAVFVALLRMLLEYFQEPLGCVAAFVEETTELQEVLMSVTLPEEMTPFFVVAGKNLFEADKFFLTLDNEILTVLTNVKDAFTMLFTAFYIFNIMYTTSAACTFTFVQKVIAGIAPEKGTKCQSHTVQKKANTKATKLYNAFVEFKQMLEEEKDD